jgi:hypothetical protein
MKKIFGTGHDQVSVNSDLGTAAFIDAKQLPVSTAQALADAAVLSAAALDATSKANARQQALVSGSNLKTINGTALLGAGDLVIASGGTPGGATTQVQYNNGGAFAGSANLTFDGTKLTAAKDAVISFITIGRGAGEVNGNTAVGYLALTANAGGYRNTASGYATLKSTTSGYGNTASGHIALIDNTTGSNNTANGSYTLNSTTTGSGNTAIGSDALTNNTTGGHNTAIGSDALYDNTTGSGNTAFSPLNSAGTYAPVFIPTTVNDRLCMGSTGVTNAYIQVAWTVVSDARDKTDFAPVPHGLDFVRQLKPTAYRYTMTRGDTEGHGPVRYGFKAQDVLALEGDTPVIVDAEDLDKLRFNDQAMIAVLVNAIKELNAKFDAYVSTHP